MSRQLMRLVVLTACLTFTCFSLAAQTLTQRLDALLREEVISTSEVGITVYDLTEGKPLYQYQDEKLYRPASIEKIITAVTALARLGTDYTLDTRLSYTGQIVGDTLQGSLRLTGGLDPQLSDEDLSRLADAIAAKGIRYVADTIIADVSLMDSVYWGPGWSWDDAPWDFQPYLSPLMLNGGCVDVTVSPMQKDSLPRVTCSPASTYYKVENRAVSRNPQAGELTITRNWLEHGNLITISGNASAVKKETLSLYPSQDFFLQTFLSRLQDRGIAAHATSFACQPDTATTAISLYTLRRPLTTVLKRAMKKSDNLCAEALFYHLAAQYADHPRVSAEDGSDAIGDFMEKVLGQDPERYKIADGSGVSLYNYISPRLMLEYLKYAYRHPKVFEALYETLPIAGVDGTLKHRMKQTAARSRVRAKTGSVTGVSSLAGYAKAQNGHLLAFVIINQNVLKLSRARAFQDKVCDALARY